MDAGALPEWSQVLSLSPSCLGATSVSIQEIQQDRVYPNWSILECRMAGSRQHVEFRPGDGAEDSHRFFYRGEILVTRYDHNGQVDFSQFGLSEKGLEHAHRLRETQLPESLSNDRA